MLKIVDLQNPKSPKKLGRWWLPGTKMGDNAPEPARVKPFDSGFRLHTPLVPPERPDRAYRRRLFLPSKSQGASLPRHSQWLGSLDKRIFARLRSSR